MGARERAIDRLRRASERRETLSILGSGSRRVSWTDGQNALSTREFDGLDLIDVDERIATVESGVTLEELHGQLTRHGLMFPPSFPAAGLRRLGLEGFARGTIGGLFSDPRESPTFPQRGQVRDHVLGVEAVRGDGTPFKAGGRVVKNVTGYDLTRLLCGARGRLGLVTRLHLRLDSLPEAVLWTTIRYSNDAELFDALAEVRVTGREPLLLAVQPEPVSTRDRWRIVLADAGRRQVAYLQLGRLLERLSRQPEDGIVEVPGAASVLGRDGGLPEDLAAPRTTTALRFRVRLPFRRWCGFIRALPLTRLPVEWETVFPFAHFGIARWTGKSPGRRRPDLDGLRRLAEEHGGSAVVEEWPSDWEPNDDPLADSSPTSSRLLRQIGLAWDPSGVLWRNQEQSR